MVKRFLFILLLLFCAAYTAFAFATDKTVHVKSYTKKDGTVVKAHNRAAPKSKQAPAELVKLNTIPANVPKNGNADNYYDSNGIFRDGKTGKIHRSTAAKNEFKKKYPCPSTGKSSGACLGYEIDHINPLKYGGSDTPLNMQWLSVGEHRKKTATQ